MKPSLLISLFLSIVFVLQPVAGLAFETDQYNLPPVPLADVGDEVTDHVADSLRGAVAKINAGIAHSKLCLDIDSRPGYKCASVGEESRKLTYLRSNDAVAYEVFKLLGDGTIFVSNFGKWLNSHKFRSEPSRYKTGFLESIYVTLPADYLTISPTVKLFATEFGVDKLDHLAQQGYKYYKIQKEAIAKGASIDDATKKAIRWGQKTERTYFGSWVSGVYSNADLYSNYAGMKFYQGLTEPVRIGDKTRPAMAVLKDGEWTVANDPVLRENLLKPFLTDHLNEALNPSGYSLILFPAVRRIVRKNSCPEWRRLYPDLTQAALVNRSKALELWHGEDYGFTKKDHVVTIGETCFGNGSR